MGVLYVAGRPLASAAARRPSFPKKSAPRVDNFGKGIILMRKVAEVSLQEQGVRGFSAAGVNFSGHGAQ
jgi:hypothetical protein